MWSEKITDIGTFQNSIELTECKANYMAKIIWRTKEVSYVVDLPKIKEKSTFLREDTANNITLPKDCDYILFNTELKKTYLVELKSQTSTTKPCDIQMQLDSGQKWWEHITFCMGKHDDFKDYILYKVVIYVNAPKAKRKPKLETPSNSKYSFLRGYGATIILY